MQLKQEKQQNLIPQIVLTVRANRRVCVVRVVNNKKRPPDGLFRNFMLFL